jgi:hypothetical protein
MSIRGRPGGGDRRLLTDAGDRPRIASASFAAARSAGRVGLQRNHEIYAEAEAARRKYFASGMGAAAGKRNWCGIASDSI